MDEIKFTPEFIERQRELIARVTSLPWSGAGRPPCIIDKDHKRIFTGLDSNVPGELDNWAEIFYAEDAANHYPAALDRIAALEAQNAKLREALKPLIARDCICENCKAARAAIAKTERGECSPLACVFAAVVLIAGWLIGSALWDAAAALGKAIFGGA